MTIIEKPTRPAEVPRARRANYHRGCRLLLDELLHAAALDMFLGVAMQENDLLGFRQSVLHGLA
ncbi:hypothetical protein, partial [Rhizobium johnstonii]|uniref:hypothetical protein n=1 Tax=Rhizobium johnstonii TaxID=3019933 RepID=UPI003F960BA2